MTMARSIRWFLVAVALLGLTGCKVELHTGLSEDEGNEMVALLLSHDIDAAKTAAGKEGVALMVASADLATAINILRDNGYPRDKFNDLGSIFEKQGLISSPLEERARFIYAMSQSFSETLAQIDGVVKARVHVNLPEQDTLAAEPPKSTASVFLKTKPGARLEDKIPEIKMIVQNSVEGLKYEDVAVVIFEAEAPPASATSSGPTLSKVLGVRITQDSVGMFAFVAVFFGLLLLAAVGASAYFFLRLRQLQR